MKHNPATGLTDLQEQAGRCLATGISEQATAEHLGKHPKTITRWLGRPEFQAYLNTWRRKAEAKAEVKQDELADAQAELAKTEQKVYEKALGKLIYLLDEADDKVLVAAIKEARECFKGSGKAGGDLQELVAGIIAGKAGNELIPLNKEAPPVGYGRIEAPKEVMH